MNYFQIGKDYFDDHQVKGAHEFAKTLKEDDATEFAHGLFMASFDALMDTLRRRITRLSFDKQDQFWTDVRILLDKIEAE